MPIARGAAAGYSMPGRFDQAAKGINELYARIQEQATAERGQRYDLEKLGVQEAGAMGRASLAAGYAPTGTSVEDLQARDLYPQSGDVYTGEGIPESVMGMPLTKYTTTTGRGNRTVSKPTYEDPISKVGSVISTLLQQAPYSTNPEAAEKLLDKYFDMVNKRISSIEGSETGTAKGTKFSQSQIDAYNKARSEGKSVKEAKKIAGIK